MQNMRDFGAEGKPSNGWGRERRKETRARVLVWSGICLYGNDARVGSPVHSAISSSGWIHLLGGRNPTEMARFGS